MADDNWFERYDAASHARAEAREKLEAAFTQLEIAKYQHKRAEELLLSIFREKVELKG